MATLAPHPPSSIADLLAHTVDGLWDDTKELKHFLCLAETYCHKGKEYYDKGNLENAFVYFAKAATLVLDKISTHRDYDVKLKPVHKNNLDLVHFFTTFLEGGLLKREGGRMDKIYWII
ncbi:hypothetical protein BDQ17DRAFT_1263985 [Cyathus striatus]|nr:hypothetical protein BDQ17DRAFT_1263985 [Cyathus striatus]